jgi:hypothetical protein
MDTAQSETQAEQGEPATQNVPENADDQGWGEVGKKE